MVTKINKFERQKKIISNKQTFTFQYEYISFVIQIRTNTKNKNAKKARSSQCSTLFEYLYSTVDFRFSFHLLWIRILLLARGPLHFGVECST